MAGDDEVDSLELSFGGLNLTVSRVRRGGVPPGGGAARTAAHEAPTAKAAGAPPPRSGGGCGAGAGPAAGPRGPAGAEREPEPEEETIGERIYVIARNRFDPATEGIWTGGHPETWNAITARLKGGQLFGSGAALVRVETMEEARRAWTGQRQRLRLSAAPPPVFRV